MQNEKEQEMSPANPTVATPSSQRDLVHSLEILDTEFNSRPIGKHPLVFLLSSLSVFFSFTLLFISHHHVHALFHDTVLCVSQWNGPVSRTTKRKWVWQTVELPLSGTINTFSFFSCPSLIPSEYWWVANERKENQPAEEVAQEHL